MSVGRELQSPDRRRGWWWIGTFPTAPSPVTTHCRAVSAHIYRWMLRSYLQRLGRRRSSHGETLKCSKSLWGLFALLLGNRARGPSVTGGRTAACQSLVILACRSLIARELNVPIAGGNRSGGYAEGARTAGGDTSLGARSRQGSWALDIATLALHCRLIMPSSVQRDCEFKWVVGNGVRWGWVEGQARTGRERVGLAGAGDRATHSRGLAQTVLKLCNARPRGGQQGQGEWVETFERSFRIQSGLRPIGESRAKTGGRLATSCKGV
jgi:hypothetical protein